MEHLVETRDKILHAAIELIKQKGYKGTTTRAIAEKAGVNEVTIFRHFKNKEGIIKAAFEKTSYVPSLHKAICEHMTGDLEKDLLSFAKLYQHLLKQNSDLIWISLKEFEMTNSLDQEISNIPKTLKEALMDYFVQMKKDNKIIETNLEAQALSFIWMNFGYFQSSNRYRNQITILSEDEFLQNSIKVFARGLKP